MSASIVSLPDQHRHRPVSPKIDDRTPDPFDTYVGCLMSTGYALSGALLASTSQEQRCLEKLIDEPALLARIAAHPAREKLSKFLLGYTLLEHARNQLWYEIEDLMSGK